MRWATPVVTVASPSRNAPITSQSAGVGKTAENNRGGHSLPEKDHQYHAKKHRRYAHGQDFADPQHDDEGEYGQGDLPVTAQGRYGQRDTMRATTMAPIKRITAL